MTSMACASKSGTNAGTFGKTSQDKTLLSGPTICLKAVGVHCFPHHYNTSMALK